MGGGGLWASGLGRRCRCAGGPGGGGCVSCFLCLWSGSVDGYDSGCRWARGLFELLTGEVILASLVAMLTIIQGQDGKADFAIEAMLWPSDGCWTGVEQLFRHGHRRPTSVYDRQTRPGKQLPKNLGHRQNCAGDVIGSGGWRRDLPALGMVRGGVQGRGEGRSLDCWPSGCQINRRHVWLSRFWRAELLGWCDDRRRLRRMSGGLGAVLLCLVSSRSHPQSLPSLQVGITRAS